MKGDVLTYKDFIGTVHYSSEDDVFFGKIEGINDLITFEGDSVRVLRRAFEEALRLPGRDLKPDNGLRTGSRRCELLISIVISM